MKRLYLVCWHYTLCRLVVNMHVEKIRCKNNGGISFMAKAKNKKNEKNLIAETAAKIVGSSKVVLDDLKEKAKPVIEDVKEKAKPVIEDVKEKASPVIEEVKEKSAPVAQAVKEKTEPATKIVKEKAAAATETVKKSVKSVTEKFVDQQVFIQYKGKEVLVKDIEKQAEEQYVNDGNKAGVLKEIKIYIKPEDNAAYYVINDSYSGKVSF